LKKLVVVCALVVAGLMAMPATAQETPASMVDTYSALADAILGLKKAEVSFVTSLLESHYQHGMAAAMKGDFAGASAQMALVANEGDNAIGGIRKRLVDGGHHHHHADGEGHHHADDEGHHADDAGSHHADDEGDAAYDTGFVIVTKAAKAEMLAASAAMRSAGDEAAAMMAWEKFAAAYGALFE
jgi:hypothetical protein